MARTRSQRAHEDVLQAASRVLLDDGIEGFTIDEVVTRSGVAKTTIYRWWPSRQALLLDVIRTQLVPAATPNTGDARADLAAYLSIYVTKPLDTPAVSLLAGLCAAAQHDPELAPLRDAFIAAKRQPVITILELARARGELAADADLGLIATMIVGPLAYRRSLCGQPVDHELIGEVIDAALAHGARERERVGR